MAEGDELVILESMKMEIPVTAPVRRHRHRGPRRPRGQGPGGRRGGRARSVIHVELGGATSWSSPSTGPSAATPSTSRRWSALRAAIDAARADARGPGAGADRRRRHVLRRRRPHRGRGRRRSPPRCARVLDRPHRAARGHDRRGRRRRPRRRHAAGGGLRPAGGDARRRCFGIPAARLGLMVDRWTVQRLVALVGGGRRPGPCCWRPRPTPATDAHRLGLRPAPRRARRRAGLGQRHRRAGAAAASPATSWSSSTPTTRPPSPRPPPGRWAATTPSRARRLPREARPGSPAAEPPLAPVGVAIARVIGSTARTIQPRHHEARRRTGAPRPSDVRRQQAVDVLVEEVQEHEERQRRRRARRSSGGCAGPSHQPPSATADAGQAPQRAPAATRRGRRTSPAGTTRRRAAIDGGRLVARPPWPSWCRRGRPCVVDAGVATALDSGGGVGRGRRGGGGGGGAATSGDDSAGSKAAVTMIRFLAEYFGSHDVSVRRSSGVSVEDAESPTAARSRCP